MWRLPVVKTKHISDQCLRGNFKVLHVVPDKMKETHFLFFLLSTIKSPRQYVKNKYKKILRGGEKKVDYT